MNDNFIVTIDGPAASGKSTIAKLLTERDGFFHIDTGAIYRAVGYIFKGNPVRDELERLNLFIEKNKKIVIRYNGKDIEEFIRTEECGMLASNTAKLDFVRDFVNNTARKIVSHGKYVIDGRDCGSVIFPRADLKIFLVADIKERAKRRAEEESGNINSLKKKIEKRDKQDKNRDIAPLAKPDGAVEIDTTDLSIEDVYKKVKDLIGKTV